VAERRREDVRFRGGPRHGLSRSTPEDRIDLELGDGDGEVSPQEITTDELVA
jgi:hypothetical protein